MRCNIVSPEILTDQHLIAEKRELNMIPPLFQKRWNSLGRKMFNDIPDVCPLGKGHMIFWTNKLTYLRDRYNHITLEMQYRGFKPDLSIQFSLTDEMIVYSVPWSPTPNDISLLKNRIREKLLQKPEWYRFHSRPIDLEFIYENYL